MVHHNPRLKGLAAYGNEKTKNHKGIHEKTKKRKKSL